MSHYSKLASAIYNDIVSGLQGYHSNDSLSLEQLEDDIIDERLQLIKEYSLKGILPKRELLSSINCISTECKDMLSCKCNSKISGIPTMHFEIPQLLTDFAGCIEYIGSIDKQLPFTFYFSPNTFKYHKYRKWNSNKPYVYIDTTPNENNMNDCWVFNAPLLKCVSVIAIFKDPRQVVNCSEDDEIGSQTFLDAEIKRRVTEKKIKYYRQLAHPVMPNDQKPKQ